MKTPLLLALPVLAAAALALAPVAGARTDENGGGATRAVFVQTNDPGGNTILAYTRADDGILASAGSYATGGDGAVQDGAVADTLASQGSLAYDPGHRLLFAVNAGSDSLSVFGVDGTTLSLLQVVPSGGAFPSSVAVHGNLVYVLNAGGAGSVQGFRITGNHLTPLHDGSRSLGLSNAETPNFVMSPGQVGFSPDGSRLIVTTKMSGSTIDVFQVEPNGRLSNTPVANGSANPVPFAFTFDPAGRLVVAEVGGSNVTTYALGTDGTLSNPQSADGQRVGALLDRRRRRLLLCVEHRQRQRQWLHDRRQRPVRRCSASSRRRQRARSTPPLRVTGNSSTSRPVSAARSRSTASRATAP